MLLLQSTEEPQASSSQTGAVANILGVTSSLGREITSPAKGQHSGLPPAAGLGLTTAAHLRKVTAPPCLSCSPVISLSALLPWQDHWLSPLPSLDPTPIPAAGQEFPVWLAHPFLEVNSPWFLLLTRCSKAGPACWWSPRGFSHPWDPAGPDQEISYPEELQSSGTGWHLGEEASTCLNSTWGEWITTYSLA